MTIRELKQSFAGEFDAIEIYSYTGIKRRMHSDCIKSEENAPEDCVATDWSLMDEAEYNEMVLANSCVSADFESWYGKENAKVLVAVIDADSERLADEYTLIDVKNGDEFETTLHADNDINACNMAATEWSRLTERDRALRSEFYLIAGPAYDGDGGWAGTSPIWDALP